MAIRTTDAAVKDIIEVDSAIATTPFIEVASSIVDDCCTSSSYTTAKLELIERWLAAHFYAIRDQRVASEKAGPVGQNFQYKLGLNLANTMYGQQAMLIDFKGNLAALSKQMEKGKLSKIGATWLGKGNSFGDDISE